MVYNPVQNNSMPFKCKLKNISWKVINKTIFRFTPPLFNNI